MTVANAPCIRGGGARYGDCMRRQTCSPSAAASQTMAGLGLTPETWPLSTAAT